jgi:hypothetical protein
MLHPHPRWGLVTSSPSLTRIPATGSRFDHSVTPPSVTRRSLTRTTRKLAPAPTLVGPCAPHPLATSPHGPAPAPLPVTDSAFDFGTPLRSGRPRRRALTRIGPVGPMLQVTSPGRPAPMPRPAPTRARVLGPSAAQGPGVVTSGDSDAAPGHPGRPAPSADPTLTGLRPRSAGSKPTQRTIIPIVTVPILAPDSQVPCVRPPGVLPRPTSGSSGRDEVLGRGDHWHGTGCQ